MPATKRRPTLRIDKSSGIARARRAVRSDLDEPNGPNRLFVDWDAFCRPAVRLKFNDSNWTMITRESALALVKMGAIAAPE